LLLDLLFSALGIALLVGGATLQPRQFIGMALTVGGIALVSSA